MSDITLTTSAMGKLADRLKHRQGKVLPVMQQAMSRTAMATIADIKVRMRGGQGTNAVRSGRLRSSMGQVTTVTGDIINTLLGSMGVIYARIQEFGGVVRPKKSKYLAIPLGPAKTAAGVSRYASPRDVAGLVFFKSKKGALLLGMKTGAKKGARLVPWFVLVKSVTLKPRLGLRDTIKKFFGGSGSRLESEVKKGVEQVMRD